MGSWITKNGRHIFIGGNSTGISYSDSRPERNETQYTKYRESELLAFARMKSELAKTDVFEHAKTIIKTSAPIITSFDPTLATAYGLYRFGKYGFNFLYKVHQESKTAGSYEQALRNVTNRELKQTVVSKFKESSIKNASVYAGKSLWLHYKECNPNDKISEKWDQFAENALIQTFEEIGTKVF